MKRPNIFIIGAPKCGTTALAEWLRQHPQVFFPARKEPLFFNVDGKVSTRTLREYEALFTNADERHLAVGEASTHYLYSREAVRRILAYQPAARLIVCLRNPLEMAPSWHRENIKQGFETERSFERAWRLQAARAAGRHLPPTARIDPALLQYGEYCKLGEQLERVLGHAGPDRVLPILLEDARRDASSQYRRVLRFLGLEDDGRQEFRVINRARRTRSTRVAVLCRRASELKRRFGLRPQIGVLRVLSGMNTTVVTNESSPTGQFRDELCRFFSDDVNRLASLLDRDLSSWLAASECAPVKSADAKG